jgi:hydrogenase maturation protease
MFAKRPKILILGIGNILLRDEGVGVHVIEYLQQQKIPDDVELMDGGTAGADLLEHICGREKVIVIDAIQSDYLPASIVRMTPQDLVPDNAPQLSIHSLDLPQTLAMAELLDCPSKDVVIFGIQPEKVECGLEMTAAIRAIIPQVARLVLEEIKKTANVGASL